MKDLAPVQSILNFPPETAENTIKVCPSIAHQLNVVEAEMKLRQQPNITELMELVSTNMFNTAAAELLRKHHADTAASVRDTDNLLAKRHHLRATILDLIITGIEINEESVTAPPERFEELVKRATT